ncbi:MAG TPA: glycosyltransferase [Dehalococcoidia bacterium]|nr:glycosyltransferase [Dehalococcoidia bacterium]
MGGESEARAGAAAELDILIPTYGRVSALAVTLTSLVAQAFRSFRVSISDQNDGTDVAAQPEVQAAIRVLRLHGHDVTVHKHLPRRGMAEQRDFLLGQVRTPYALYLDDDLILEPYVVGLMLQSIRALRCGFVGCGVIGLSHLADVREREQAVELWTGSVTPERVEPGTAAWERHRLHNAANLLHVQQRLGATPDRPLAYKVAWVGGCVLYDAEKLRRAGGFSFWQRLPETHAGEDVLAQLRVMERYGGCGLMPSGVYHQELPTTIPDRRVDAPVALSAPAG